MHGQIKSVSLIARAIGKPDLLRDASPHDEVLNLDVAHPRVLVQEMIVIPPVLSWILGAFPTKKWRTARVARHLLSLFESGHAHHSLLVEWLKMPAVRDYNDPCRS